MWLAFKTKLHSCSRTHLLLLVGLGTLFALPIIANPEVGYDTPQHVSKVVYLADWFPYVGWDRRWQFGRHFLLYYPPFSYYLVATFSLFLPLMAAYALCTWMALLLPPLALYMLLRAWDFEPLPALVSGVLLLTSWAHLGSLYVYGQLPFTFGWGFVLLFFAAWERLDSPASHILCSVLLALVVTTHQLPVVALIMMGIPYVLLNPGRRPIRQTITSGLIVGLLGAALSATSWLPMLWSMGGAHLFGTHYPDPSLARLFLLWPSSFYETYYFLGQPLGVLLLLTLLAMGMGRLRLNRRLALASVWGGLFLAVATNKELSVPEIAVAKHVVSAAIGLTILAAFGLRYVIKDRIRMAMYLLLPLAAFGGLGVCAMWLRSPFLTPDDDANAIARELAERSKPLERIYYRDIYGMNWFNAFSSRLQTGGGGQEGIINYDLARTLLKTPAEDVEERMRQLGLRYLVVHEPDAEAFTRQERIDTVCRHGSSRLLKARGIEPELVTCSGGRIQNMNWDHPDELAVEFVGRKAVQHILVRNSYHNAWRGALDGEPVRVEAGAQGFARVTVRGEGRHILTLRYEHPIRWIAMSITLLALLVTVCTGLYLRLPGSGSEEG